MSSPYLRPVATVDEVIDALGGTGAVAKMTGRKPQHVSNWRAEQRIPGPTYLRLQKALMALHIYAPPSLWGMEDEIAPT